MIDLRSDTVTQPTQAMRDAMYAAAVGDDVYGDDPTVNALEALAARMLDKEAALFVTSGTMGNQLGIMSQTRHGDEIILSANCHIFEHEAGAAAVLSGANQRQLTFENGLYDAEMIERAIRPLNDIHQPETKLICMENALANGRVVPVATMRAVYDVGRRHGIRVHLDGARLFNAAVALDVPVTELTRYCDTVSCCLSKGLCAPVGSIFAGPRETVERARKCRKMLGGGMRQAGFLAAAGIIALRDMPARLIEDHANARRMATLLNAIPGVRVDMDSVQINMVFAVINRPARVLDAVPAWLKAHGVLANAHENGVMRFVTNKDVSSADVERAVSLLTEALNVCEQSSRA